MHPQILWTLTNKEKTSSKADVTFLSSAQIFYWNSSQPSFLINLEKGVTNTAADNHGAQTPSHGPSLPSLTTAAGSVAGSVNLGIDIQVAASGWSVSWVAAFGLGLTTIIFLLLTLGPEKKKSSFCFCNQVLHAKSTLPSFSLILSCLCRCFIYLFF